MGRYVIEVENLTRRFGSFVAVDGVNFRIGEGEIFGLIGPNGAGKTTLIRMLCGILVASSGKGRVGDFDIIRESERIKSIIGYTAQRFSLYDDLTVEENLEFFVNLYGKKKRVVDGDGILRRFRIEGYRRRLAGHLSGGTKQKLAMACAVSHDPEILFLDEPTAGVDPLSSREIWSMLYEFAEQGMTVFVTTHYMNEAERCGRLCFIYQGKVIALGSPQELKANFKEEMILEIRGDVPLTGMIGDFQKMEPVMNASTSGEFLRVATKKPDEVKRLAGELAVNKGIRLDVEEAVPSLEDVFISLTRGE